MNARPPLGLLPCQPVSAASAPASAGLPPAPRSCGTPCASVLEQPGLDVLDIGGGTGGFAVRVAGLGHRVTVVDPSPDALAALARRARESGVADRVTGQQGDLGHLLDAGPGPPASTWCSATACSRSSTTPPPRWPRSREVLRPGGDPQPAGRPAARRRGRPGDGRPLRPGPGPARRPTSGGPARPAAGSPPTRSPRCSPTPASTPASVHGVRVFADLVPGSLLDLEPGASRRPASSSSRPSPTRPEYLPLATQLHVARRPQRLTGVTTVRCATLDGPARCDGRPVHGFAGTSRPCRDQ